MKLIFLYIPIVLITWMATLFHENKKVVSHKNDVSFELFPSTILFQYN